MHMLVWCLTGSNLGLVEFVTFSGHGAARKSDFGHENRVLQPPGPPEDEAALAATHCDSLDEMTSIADVLSLHYPGSVETHHVINERRPGQMKRTAIPINTARGTMVNESELAAALNSS
jgi:lactate dehydrogenase-like 2-hydroxyacid dehydrogenase